MIDLYDRGREKFGWWPDWRGCDAVLIASGHSAIRFDYKFLWPLADVKVAVIRMNVDLYPHCDLVYSADEDWWNHALGLPWFEGLKLTNARNVCNRYKGLYRVETVLTSDVLLLKEPGVIGSGGNSGFHLYNLVVQFGVSRIVLVGFDMDPSTSPHWYGKNKWKGSSNPKERSFERWRMAFENSSSKVARLGIQVVNAGLCSTLKSFPKLDQEEVLRFLAA